MCSTFHTSECVCVPHFRMHSTLQNVFVFHTLECILHFRMCSAFHSARVGTVIYSQCSPTIEDNHQTALWLGNHSKTCTTANCTEKDTKVRMHNANITDMGVFLCVCAQVMERDVCVCVYKNRYVTHSTESVSSFFSANLNQNLWNNQIQKIKMVYLHSWVQ